jgi:hypothetical protein
MSAGAAKRTTCQNGKFQGMTASTTPRGWTATMLRGALREVFASKGALFDLGSRFGDRLPHLERREAGVALGALPEERGERAHRDGPLCDRTVAPLEECVVGLGDRHLDLVGAKRVERRDNFLGRRIHRADLPDRCRHMTRG